MLIILVLILIISVSRFIGELFIKIGQPRVVGEMLSGVILGPTVFGFFAPNIYETLFTIEIKSTLYILSTLGLTIFMFLTGLELNIKKTDKDIHKSSILLSFGGFFIPLLTGVFLGFLLKDSYMPATTNFYHFTLFIGICLSMTAFPMLVRILQELNMTKTRLGLLATLSAAIIDVIGWIFLAVLTTSMNSNSITGGLFALIIAFSLTIFLLLIIKPYMRRVSERIKKNNKIFENDFALVIMLILCCSAITHYIGMHSIFGGFILGFIMPKSSLFIEKIKTRLYDFTIVFLIPIFFTYSGINTKFNEFNISLISIFFLVLLLSFGSKYISCTLITKKIGFSWKEASSMGTLMNARGLMELIVLNVGLKYGVITPDIFSMFAWMAIITTALTMPLFRLSIHPYQKKELTTDNKSNFSEPMYVKKINEDSF
ncbi:cation:proton antiporter [Bacillus cereus]|uniref:cation:proton antiporter n=1 Tax=Bacillus cereus TaxID=1396 RepID=UPI0039819260